MGVFLATTLLSQVADQRAIREETKASVAQSRFNQQIAQRNRALSIEQAKQEAGDTRRATARAVSAARATSVASGVLTTEGSALVAQSQIAFEGERQALSRARQGEIEARGFESELGFRGFEESLAKRRGSIRSTGSLLQGIAGGARGALAIRNSKE